jgi:hypothetical protein
MLILVSFIPVAIVLGCLIQRRHTNTRTSPLPT